MSPALTRTTNTPVVALDGDKLGQIAGTIAALLVMAFCFFYHHTDALTATIRAGWAFVVGYGATFFFARIILYTTLFELVKAERDRRHGLFEEDEHEEQEESLTPPLDLEDLGLEPLAPADAID